MHQPKTASEKTINGKKENKKENLERAINCHSSSFKKKNHTLAPKMPTKNLFMKTKKEEEKCLNR